MSHLTLRQGAVVAVHAFVGWALCAATMGLGIATTGLHNALIIHAVAVPVIFTTISALYFARFGYTHPSTTAAVFVAIVVFLDAFIVAVLVERSFEMFTSFVGTWLPFALIFGSTYITGIVMRPTRSQGTPPVTQWNLDSKRCSLKSGRKRWSHRLVWRLNQATTTCKN